MSGTTTTNGDTGAGAGAGAGAGGHGGPAGSMESLPESGKEQEGGIGEEGRVRVVEC